MNDEAEQAEWRTEAFVIGEPPIACGGAGVNNIKGCLVVSADYAHHCVSCRH